MATHLGQSNQSKLASQGQVKDGGGGNLGEEQLLLNIKQLDLLHVKCRELRTTIQRMLEAIPTGTTTPEEVHETFLKSVVTADAEIKDFGTLYNSEETKKVLDQAKKSRDANPKGIKPWRAKDHPDWLDVAR
ncbi:uncharacterized protein GGS22DRAFT_79756 [Annulohypoxylon maeteangense]|uniref:uncharacterized protein n=1 Tax=Annulohypoxylon maeteangense TaxID=1927788 RepID=UPI0020079CE4|nr:uncharacterized protein GGS22DRAFT_79756 [Annulohypoxylon maeteangense]KAI0880754.1 hypothetical protein GGS22DRAFT_79756 [Annulohypoxylon maeteangense]